MDPWTEAVLPASTDPELAGALVETVVVNHYRRFAPTLYIKGRHGEVDLALVRDGGFEPIEVEWRRRLRAQDLKQVRRYPNGRVLARVPRRVVVDGVPTEPLSVALVRLDGGGAEVP